MPVSELANQAESRLGVPVQNNPFLVLFYTVIVPRKKIPKSFVCGHTWLRGDMYVADLALKIFLVVLEYDRNDAVILVVVAFVCIPLLKIAIATDVAGGTAGTTRNVCSTAFSAFRILVRIKR